jgi:asparagine synthase (glutamine-hydrolysing)
MCGILAWYQRDQQIDNDLFHQMLQTLHHRGPDSEGVTMYKNGHLALGHKRLSFLDLSAAGSQPMQSVNGRYAIVLNGEIYNYLEIKEQLSTTYEFQTETDTEVVLAAFENWGIDSLNYLKGMFGMVVYDQVLNVVYLIRDRFGIKPLYYSVQNGHLLVASELKAIIASGLNFTLNRAAIIDYFVYRYVPSPLSIWTEINKVEPAHYIKVELANLKVEKQQYWQLQEGNQRNLQNQIKEELQLSLKTHLRADVQIGAFLSGGYDSSALVAIAKEQGQRLPTYSIGFKNWEKSEDYYAALVADHLGVSNKRYVTDELDLSLLKKMPLVYDEPIADISILPTYLVSQLAATEVKAVIGGEGADEIFLGYTWQKDWLKQNKRSISFLKPNPQKLLDFYAASMAMGQFDHKELHEMLGADWKPYIQKDVHWFYRKHIRKDLSYQRQIQYLDLRTFMCELVLTKIDRASMAHSLEVRVPFLDHELVSTVFSQRKKDNFDPMQTKMNLFNLIRELLPEKILKREKQGFVGPDAYYMNLHFYKAELADSHLVKDGVICQSYLDKLFQETYNWRLWKILVLENWYRHWVSSNTATHG